VKITFSCSVPIEDTLVFEEIFEEPLRLSLEEKAELREANWWAVWMLVDGVLAGEAYGVRLADLDEEIEDCRGEDPATIYCYSTGLLPQFQGRGLSVPLKAFWLGMTFPETIVGHATSDAALHLNQKFGAEIVAEHDRWYGTERRAFFYRIRGALGARSHR
jgi:hypothetical protein